MNKVRGMKEFLRVIDNGAAKELKGLLIQISQEVKGNGFLTLIDWTDH